jgi:hypothetical protein
MNDINQMGFVALAVHGHFREIAVRIGRAVYWEAWYRLPKGGRVMRLLDATLYKWVRV